MKDAIVWTLGGIIGIELGLLLMALTMPDHPVMVDMRQWVYANIPH